MTPVLMGRWQTRLWLTLTTSTLITLIFGYVFTDYTTVFSVLAYSTLVGIALDPLYDRIQQRRWDADWGPMDQLWSGVLEGAILFGLLLLSRTYLELDIPGQSVSFWRFCAHFGTVWLQGFLMSQGPLRVLYPAWRFSGGRIV